MSLLRKLRDTLRSHRMDAELDDEFQFHLAQRVEHLVAQGASPEEARSQAARLFGNRAHLRESTRDRNVLPGLQAVLQDLRFAVRNMRRNPAFAVAAVLSLALGIGANAALFSVLDGLLLRLLPVEDPHSLVLLRDTTSDRFAYPSYELLRDHSRLLSGVAGVQYLPGTLEITDHGRSTQAAMQAISGNYFQMLGVSAARGRTLAPGELHVAVISDRYWRAHYNSSLDAIGDRFQRLEWEYTVIGIAPPGFQGVLLDTPADIFIPLEDWIPKEEPYRSRGRLVSLVARMRPGVTRPQVAAEAGALLHRAIHVDGGRTGISTLRNRIARPLLVLDFLVAFVLLIACSNLANLALASTAARQREMAVRQAIGAGRARLISQLLTESALLAVAGGTLAIVVAQWISGSLLLFLPPNRVTILPNLSFRPDAHVLGFTAALTLATCLLFGLAPALRATRSAPLAGLRQTPGAGHTSPGWLSRGLVVGEVGLCTAVLVTTGLFVRTLHNLQSLDPALAPEQIVTANIPIVRGVSDAQRVRAFDTLSARAGAVDGVRAAGYIHVRPLTGQGLNANVQLPGCQRISGHFHGEDLPGSAGGLGNSAAGGPRLHRARQRERHSGRHRE